MPMTLDEAKAKWKISEKTMLKYLSKGYIDGIFLKDNIVYIPDIPTPMPIKSNVNLTCEKIYYYILKVLNERRYISSNMFGITKEHFELFLLELEKSGCVSVKAKNEPKASILRYGITPKGIDGIKGKKNTINLGYLNLNPININFSVVKVL